MWKFRGENKVGFGESEVLHRGGGTSQTRRLSRVYQVAGEHKHRRMKQLGGPERSSPQGECRRGDSRVRGMAGRVGGQVGGRQTAKEKATGWTHHF